MNISDLIDLLTYGRDHAIPTARVTIRIEGDEYDITDTLTFETDRFVLDVTGDVTP